MKKIIALTLTLLLVTGCTTAPSTSATPTPDLATSNPTSTSPSGNFSDEMKLVFDVDLDEEGGADFDQRGGDHDSAYFSTIDFYNSKSNNTLTILPQFKTMQQTSEWSCGVVSALLVMNYYDKLASYNEQTLAEMRTNGLEEDATSLASMVKIFDTVGGFDLESSFDYSAEKLAEAFPLERFETLLKEGTPVMVAWNDWGGHWQVVIGYDNMGTETTSDDVLIVADPYDTTDHNQDGYMVYGAERFYYNWTMFDFFEQRNIENERDMMFLIAAPQK